MINLFILSIFDRLRVKIKFITFKEFCKMVNLSQIGLEVVEMLKTPFELCLGRKNHAFQGPDPDPSDLALHENTRNSLLHLLYSENNNRS